VLREYFGSLIGITNAYYWTADGRQEPFDKVYWGYYFLYATPDLTIEGIVLPYVGPVPLVYPTPEPQLYYDINVTVASTVADAGFFNVSLTVHLDGEIMPEYGRERTVEGLRQDTSETVTFDFNPQDYGNYTLTITADCDDDIFEDDETNNVKVTWVLGTIRGDFDGDGDVDPDDFSVFAGIYGSRFTSPPYPTADIDWDGDVDPDDFSIFAGNYGQTA